MALWNADELETNERDKDRLYLALHDKSPASDYHWSILLCPKKESVGHRSCTLYDVTNSERKVDGLTISNGEWWYRCRQVDLSELGRLIARVLVTKIPKGQADLIDADFETLPIAQDALSGSGIAWVRDALDRLRELGFKDIRPWEELEGPTLLFAHASKRNFLQSQGGGGRRQPPTQDMRVGH